MDSPYVFADIVRVAALVTGGALIFAIAQSVFWLARSRTMKRFALLAGSHMTLVIIGFCTLYPRIHTPLTWLAPTLLFAHCLGLTGYYVLRRHGEWPPPRDV